MSQRKTKLNFKNQGAKPKLNFRTQKKTSFADVEQISYNLADNLNKMLTDHLATESVAKLDAKFHELEFRVGEFITTRQNQKFHAYMSRLKFNRIIKYYHEKYHSGNLIENISLDIVHDSNYRVTITAESLNNSKSEIEYFCKTNRLRQAEYMQKTQLAKSDNQDWNYRLTSSHESPITNKAEQLKIRHGVEDKTISKFYRYKYRYSFQLTPQVRLDLTIVKESPQGITAGTLVSSRTLAQPEKYQVELEYTGQNFKLDHLKTILSPYLSEMLSLYLGIKGSRIAISRSHHDLVLTQYLKLALDGTQISLEEIHNRRTTNKFLAMDLEALTRQNFNTIQENYMVTVKADGEHYLLYLNSAGALYLINNRLEVSPVVLSELDTPDKREQLKDMGESIFDGELVEHDGKFRFLIFDCFFSRGTDVRNLPLFIKNKLPASKEFSINDQSRVFYLKQFTTKINQIIGSNVLNNDLIIESKDYFQVNKVSRFFKKDNQDQATLKDELPYNIDGLVFVPVNEIYPKIKYQNGRFSKVSSVGNPDVSPILKWKPPEFLSVDFRVNFGSKPKIQQINGKDYQVLTLESAYGSKIAAFEPSSYRVKDYNLAYIPIIKGHPQLQKREGYHVDPETEGHVIRNKDILEFIWINDRSFGQDYWGIWFPIKYREDKTSNGYPNGYRKVADRTWMAIHDRQILPENLMDPLGKVRSSPQLDMGYYQNRGRAQLFNLRGIHNSAKTILIFLSVKQAGMKSNRLMDLATGRAGDLFKWNGVKYVFGIEFDEGNIKAGQDSAYSRYSDRIEKSYMNDRKPPFVLDLIQGDMGQLFNDNRVSNESVMNYIMKERLSRYKESFGVISCQFAIHYICNSEDRIDNFFRNISENLAPGGYFIATTFDGEKIFNALANTKLTDDEGQPLLEGLDKDGTRMWSISSPTKYNKLYNAGQPIDVFNKTIKDDVETEYLVNFNYLLQVAEKYNLYPGQLSFGQTTMPIDGYGIGGFSELYDAEYLQLIGNTIYPKGSPKYKDLEKNFKQIPNDIKRYSKFSSYLVLTKNIQ